MVAGGLLFATACSPTIQTGGREIGNSDQVLQTALSKLKKDNYDSIQNNSVTVSDSTNCFFRKANEDADNITDQVACGPIRRIGQSDDHVWDTYRLTFRSAADGKSTAAVQQVVDRGVSVDTSLLLSPGDVKPGSAADVPAPQVPQTSISDRAVALPDRDISGVTFTEPAEPAELITPTARLQVLGQAEPQQVPEQLVAGQDDPAGDAPYYRPATGQKLYAYRVKITDPAEQDVPLSTSTGATVPDLTTQLTIGVGDQHLPIADHRSKPLTSFKISCGATREPYPCQPTDGTFVILMTVPDSSAVSLEATAAKHEQSVELASGHVTSTVSQVEYGREKLAAKVDEKLKVSSYEAKLSVPDADAGKTAGSEPDEADPTATDPTKTGESDKSGESDNSVDQPTPPATKIKIEKASWSMKVDSVALSAFDPTRGWAPSGKAWLMVTTSDYAKHDADNAFTDKRVSSVAVTSAGATYQPDGLTDADFAAGADLADSGDVSWVFSVPDNLTEASFDFRPTGTVAADGVSTGYAVPKPAAVNLKLPQ